jgi:hypothetical protein
MDRFHVLESVYTATTAGSTIREALAIDCANFTLAVNAHVWAVDDNAVATGWNVTRHCFKCSQSAEGKSRETLVNENIEK